MENFLQSILFFLIGFMMYGVIKKYVKKFKTDDEGRQQAFKFLAGLAIGLVVFVVVPLLFFR